mgnify:FL=1
MAESRAGNSPIEKALGEDFQNLHAAIRKHYTEPTVHISGTMEVVHVKNVIRPLALVSYWLLHAPVPHSGRDVQIRLKNRVDASGVMHWARTFSNSTSFAQPVTFKSRMICSGDHKIIEFTSFGIGVEADLRVGAGGSLIYEIRTYTLRIPFLRLIVRFPAWLSPFGGGRTKEIGETDDRFRIEFEMTHPVLGRTLSYSGRCRIESA